LWILHNILKPVEKKMFLKEKMEKKKAGITAGVEKPKGNGIKDGNEGRNICLCRKLLADYNSLKIYA
jgi:hypothetical protein